MNGLIVRFPTRVGMSALIFIKVNFPFYIYVYREVRRYKKEK